MKRVLILAYDFPPNHSIGAQRPYSWYKYLPSFDVHPVVITRFWGQVTEDPLSYIQPSKERLVEIISEKDRTLVQSPFTPNARDRLLLKYGMRRMALIRRLLSFFFSVGCFWFGVFDEKRRIKIAAEEYIRKHKVNAIIATGEPFVLFRYAQELSVTYNIPWIADYRDPWSNNMIDFGDSLTKLLGKLYFRPLERSIVSSATHIITAAPVYSQKIQNRITNKECKVVYNGYDEDDFTESMISSTSHVFTIAYTGRVYAHQNLELFFEALLLFKRDCVDFRVEFYGVKQDAGFRARYAPYKDALSENVILHEWVTPKHAIEAMFKADVLLLLSGKGAQWLNAKIFNYLRIKKPILLVENDQGLLENMLNETKSGIAADSAEQAYAFLRKCAEEKKQFGRVVSNPMNIEIYSRKNQAGVMAEIIHQACVA